MTLLILGLVIFLGIHIFPWHTALRQRLIDVLGYNQYRGIFSLVALSGLIIIALGKAQASFQPLWTLPIWGRTATIALMVIAFVLVPAANMPNNIKRLVRHPMLIGIIIWACAHLLANGDLASLLLFGSFALYGLLAIISANYRNKTIDLKTTDLPRVPIARDIVTVGIGLTAYATLLFLHPYLFGVPVII